MNGNSKKIYEPPISRELSSFTASGAGPSGMCIAGPRPYYNCAVGTNFVGSCSGGSLPDTSNCADGALHTFSACNFGGSASTTCISGQAQNF
jgi:hypothetical protein